jgi:putative FmdB family regulatory protein
VPTYSYRCTECDNAFDIHQAFTEDSLTVCPGCGGVLRKVFSAVGVTFNGSGFYRTDSRAGSSSSDSGSGSGSSPADSGSSASPKKESGTPSTTTAPAAAKTAAPASTSTSSGK